jgi:aminopeptidase N
MPAAEITRVETGRRARLLRVRSYEVARARACTGPPVKPMKPTAAAWQLLTGGRLGPESLSAVARGFTQPEQAGLLAPYAGRYLAELERIWSTRDGHMRVRLGELLFPYPAASPELLARIEKFLARPRDPGLARVLADHRDTIRRALRSRALPD